MMVREPPPLRIRPRLEVGDRAAQQPVVVVGLVERDKIFDRVDEVSKQGQLLNSRRAAVGTATPVGEGRMPEKVNRLAASVSVCSSGSLLTVGLWRTA